MGRWLATHFLNQGHEVTISDINLDEAEAAARVMGVNPAKSNVDAVQGAELIVVSTPIEVTPKVLMEIASHINRSAVIMEISSLKSRVVTCGSSLGKNCAARSENSFCSSALFIRFSVQVQKEQ